MQKAFAEMVEIEKGAIANQDEKRMVGHYWLRNSVLAPTPEIKKEIDDTLASIKSFSAKVHDGTIAGERGAFKNVLVIGIGGSALGPQFVANAMGQPTTDKLDVYFFDNTDPDGMDKTLGKIITELGQTVCVVISKSGGTQETKNGMLEAQAAYQAAGLDFGKHAVAITGKGSELDKFATANKWLAMFPMWDWVGGRTSELSAVGLVPASLQGCNIEAMLMGASACDGLTRVADVKANPAAQLALMWFYIGNGKGDKSMVVLPYKDRFELFSRYLQQLVMESLGKELDRDGKTVNQGISVYGNKGSTDQHAYIQQLRDGLNNFFVTFIEVLKDRDGKSILTKGDATSGDFLHGFMLGTRQALYEKGRESITLTLTEASAYSTGVLIALFERAVGLYASLININAYHQPGVEAGKKAAGTVIETQTKLLAEMGKNKTPSTVDQLGAAIGETDIEKIFKICEHLAANKDRKILRTLGKTPFDAKYQMI